MGEKLRYQDCGPIRKAARHLYLWKLPILWIARIFRFLVASPRAKAEAISVAGKFHGTWYGKLWEWERSIIEVEKMRLYHSSEEVEAQLKERAKNG